MGKNLRSSVTGQNVNTGVNKLIGQLTDRVAMLEKRYSRVMIHQTYFKLLDEWLQCMFGVELFPKTKDIDKNSDADTDEDENPFYELHMLHQRVNIMEDELQSMGIDIPQIKPKHSKSVHAAPKPIQRKSYGQQSSAIRRRSINSAAKSTAPPVLKPSAVPSKKDPPKAVDTKKATEDENIGKEKGEGKDPAADEKPPEDETDKPPVLEEIKTEVEDEDDNDDEYMEEVPDPTLDENKSAPASNEMMSDTDKMEIDEEFLEDDDFDQKPDLEDLDYEVARYTQKKVRSTGRKKSSNNGGGSDAVEEEPGHPVTYTTRGRRHTLPRRYAEFTGHDNVASILKSQQRAAGNNSAKSKKVLVEKVKPPSKPKPLPKPATPKKADGSRPECVYKLIADVQGKEVDDNGCVILWDPIPNVKVNQQQLISVIFRSNGMATRLTRKLTTLVFEDQVLANTSPFGTKYYQERLPPEPLEAMVEFISTSGFDADYTKKKIYMVVGQVCNEARAGRVRKLVPSASSSTGSVPGAIDQETPGTAAEFTPPPSAAAASNSS